MLKTRCRSCQKNDYTEYWNKIRCRNYIGNRTGKLSFNWSFCTRT